MHLFTIIHASLHGSNKDVSCMINFCHEGTGVAPFFILTNRQFPISVDAIPKSLVSEVIELCIDFGFIAGREVKFSGGMDDSEKEELSVFLESLRPDKVFLFEETIELLQSFFSRLAKIGINFSQIEEQSNAFGFFRFSSPLDIDVKKYNWSLDDFLEFLLFNTEHTYQIYRDHYVGEVFSNNGLLIDNFPERDFFYFSKNSSYTLQKCIEFGEKKYPLTLRMVPGFASPGLYFLMSVDTDSGDAMNIYAQIGVRFEKRNNIVIPIIHNIQTPSYHLFIDHQNLITIPDAQGTRLKPARELLSQKSVFDMVGAITSFFFTLGYGKMEIIDGHESLWLKYHNPNRTLESIEQSTKMYLDAGKHITGIEQNSGRVEIQFSDILNHELFRIKKLSFEEDCLKGLFMIMKHFNTDFSFDFQMERMTDEEINMFFSYIGSMRENLLHNKIHSKN